MKVNSVAEFGGAVRSSRKRLGLTQAQLAAKAHISREWISRLENGSPRLEIGLVLQALASLGLEIEIRDPATENPPKSKVELVTQFAWVSGPEAGGLTPQAKGRFARHVAERRNETRA